MPEWNPPSEETASPRGRARRGRGAWGAVLGLAALAALLIHGRRPSEGRPGLQDAATALLKPFTGRLAAGYARSPEVTSADELVVLGALMEDARFKKALLLDSRLTVRWAADPTLISKRWEKPDQDGFPGMASLAAALEGRRPAFNAGPGAQVEVVYPIALGDDAAGFLCALIRPYEASGPVRLPPSLGPAFADAEVSTAPLALEELPRGEEKNRSLARRRYLDGVIHYVRRELEQARDSWNLARRLDPSDEEPELALRQLDLAGSGGARRAPVRGER